jgi:hypothetical protein
VRATWLLCALLVGGCDVIWRIDGAHKPGVDANGFSCDQALHDEDSDGAADACDRCPGIADDQADSDTDGVGDACDPDSTVKHEIALFVSFSDGSPNWNVLSGSWVQRDDSLVYESFAQATYGVAMYPAAVPEPPYVLEAHITVDRIDLVGSVFAIAIDAESNGDGVTCGFVRRESPIRDLVRTRNIVGDAADEQPIGAITPGGYRVTTTYDRAAAVQCAIAADNDSTGGAASATLPAMPAPGGLALRSLRVGVTVSYLVFYKPR